MKNLGTPSVRAAVTCCLLVGWLLAWGASADDYGMTLLHYATWRNSAEELEVLLAAGADVNAADRNGRTPLDVALSLFSTDEDGVRVQALLRRHGGKCATRCR